MAVLLERNKNGIFVLSSLKMEAYPCLCMIHFTFVLE